MFKRVKEYIIGSYKISMNEDDYKRYLRSEFPKEYEDKYTRNQKFGIWGMR